MQVAVRGKASLVQSAAPKGARGIATHTAGMGRGPTNLGAYRNIFTRAHNVIRHTIPRLTQLLGAAPPSTGPMGPRLYHKLPETIHSRLSMSSRMALSRPLKAAGIPRPPMVPRPIYEVGLGTARKFSSQSAFQHVIQNNTSITARAFWEADWDLKAAEERRIVAKARRSVSKGSKRTKKASHTGSARFSDDMSKYFVEPTEATVTTFLQIALAPTPTTAMPLVAADEAIYLLPLRAILDNHTTFQARAQDVTAIFATLDAHNVWDDNVSVESWGDTRGLCVELRIKFEGWSAGRVRGLLGNLVDSPGCFLQETLPEPILSVLATVPGELDNSLQASNPLEFIMPRSILPHDESTLFDVSNPSTRPASPSAFSILSGVNTITPWDSEVDMSDGISHHSDSSDEWQVMQDDQSSIAILSLSSVFLNRLNDSHSVWSAE